jgi:hypothetical protein
MLQYVLVSVRVGEHIPDYHPIESFSTLDQAVTTGQSLDSDWGTHWHVLDNHTGEIVRQGKIKLLASPAR